MPKTPHQNPQMHLLIGARNERVVVSSGVVVVARVDTVGQHLEQLIHNR
jgi:hypothetical protein